MSTTCLQTRIRNTGTRENLSLNFLRRGLRLDPGEEVLIDGDVWDHIERRKRSIPEMAAFKSLLQSGDLTILDSPDEIFYDATKAQPKVMHVDNGVITIVDPCTGAWSSSM